MDFLTSIVGETKAAAAAEEGAGGSVHVGRPPLTFIGEKLHSGWMQRFLSGTLPYKPRSDLQGRMPAWAAYSGPLSKGLAQQHGYPAEDAPPVVVDAGLAEIGRKLTEVEAQFRRHRLPLLTNTHLLIQTPQGPVAVVGIDDLVAGRTAQGIHGHLDLGRDIPGAEGVYLFLELTLFCHDGVLRGIVDGVVEFVPGGVVGGGESGEVLHALLDAGANGGAGGEVRLLLEHPDIVARLEVHATVDLGVAPGEDPQQG